MTSLQQARLKSTTDKDNMAAFFYESQHQRIKHLQKIIQSTPALKFNPGNLAIGRVKLFQMMVQKQKAFYSKVPLTIQNNGIAFLLFNQQMPISLHVQMFIPTLENLCTDKQREKFLKPAQQFNILGCYAQTQLGHGSDVQSLETQALFDQRNQQFILNTPKVTSYKWWPGQLGFVSTHAAVFARLKIEKRDYGVHCFVVQLRDQKHKPLPGIKLGDIGPKYGFNAKDNGFMCMKDVRIPRDNMLMKYAKVSKNGQYKKRGNEKVSYATMLKVRCQILSVSGIIMAKATTITTRYSLQRKQFKKNNIQMPIFSYQLQKNKIIPHIAQTYVFIKAANKMKKILDLNCQKVQQDDFSMLNQCHAISSGCKAVFTNITAKAVEQMRRSCGGHGFNQYSGLPNLYKEFVAFCTLQGQNSIMLLQTSRFLLKSFNQFKKGKQISMNCEYMRNMDEQLKEKCKIKTIQQMMNGQNLRKIIRRQVIQRLFHLVNNIISASSKGNSMHTISNHLLSIQMKQLAITHIHLWTVNSFLQSISKHTLQPNRTILHNLASLYMVHTIIQNNYVNSYLQGFQYNLLQQAKQQLLQLIAPQAIALTDAFQYLLFYRLCDDVLQSAIGKYDGKPYQTLYQWAKQHNQLNKQQVRQEITKLYLEAKKGIQYKSKL